MGPMQGPPKPADAEELPPEGAPSEGGSTSAEDLSAQASASAPAPSEPASPELAPTVLEAPQPAPAELAPTVLEAPPGFAGEAASSPHGAADPLPADAPTRFTQDRTQLALPQRGGNFQGQGTLKDATDFSEEDKGLFQAQNTRLDVFDEREESFSGARTRLNVLDEGQPPTEPTRRVGRPQSREAPGSSGANAGKLSIGKYALEERLGEGGMASVFLARDEEGQAFALKILSAAIDDETVRARFQREGDVLLNLDNPGIVRLVDRGEDERSGRPYLVMELVEGRDLSLILRERPGHTLSPDEVIFILHRAARALEVAHEQGVVHRDVKPGNLLLTPLGQVKLTDFGISLSQEAQSRLTVGGALVGTPSYLAPEVLLGESWSPAADLYALGSTAFEALSGQVLFEADTAIEILSDQIQTPAPKLATLSDVPVWLSDLVDQLLAKGPDMRPTAAELVERLAPHLPAEESLERLWQEASRGGRRARLESGGPQASVGDKILNYSLREEIGRGAVGVVFRAYHEGLKKEVALKLLDAFSLAGGSREERERREARFLREAQAVATLKHPCVVPILDAGRHEGFFYIAMELVEGQSLSQVLSGDRLDLPAQVRLMADLCGGVAHAHAKGVIHRDLKPDNVIVSSESGRPLVLDFGVAKLNEEQEDITGEVLELTGEGTLVGTVQYMAPEQAAGKHSKVDVRSDVYALGVIFYELLCGRPPHQGSVRELLYLVNFEDPLPPSAHRRRVPWELDAIALKALERDRDDRYQSALEMSKDLERYLSGEPIHAKAGSLLSQASKYLARNKAQAMTTSLVALLVLALLGGWAASSAAAAADQERQAIQAAAQRETLVAKRQEEVRVLTRKAWESFHQAAFGEAAERFTAAQALVEPDELIAPSSAELALVPAEAVSELRPDQRPLLRLTNERLHQWVLLARQRAQRAQVEERVEAARAALAVGDMSQAVQGVIAARSLGGLAAAGQISQAVAETFLSQARALRSEVPQDPTARRERLEQARKLLEEAQRLEPQVALSELSLVLRELGQLAELEQALAVARAQKSRARELVGLGQEQLQGGALDEARRSFEQGLGMDGSNEDAREGLLLVERALREREEARALAERIRRTGELRTYAQNAQRLGRARYGRGELPDNVREPYTDALESLQRAALLIPDEPETQAVLREVSREYAAILIDQGQLELAQFVRRLGGLPEQDPEPPPLPRDPHLSVIEVVGASARAAFGSPVQFLPTRAFDQLRGYIAGQTSDLRFELRILGTIAREGLTPKVYCTGVEVRMFDRRRNTVSAPERVMFGGSFLRPSAVDPQGQRVLRPFTRASRFDSGPVVARVTQLVQKMVQENKD